MRIATFCLAVAIGSTALLARAEDEVVDKKRPIIVHVPVTTVLRGQPADISATITAQGGVITSAATHVKLALAGKPIEFPMSPSTGDVYKALIPVSLVKGINRFWYFIHSLDSNGRMADTLWQEVRIIDGGDLGGGAGAGAGGGSNKGLWIGGGALVVGGIAAAIIANNDGGGGGGNPPPVTTVTPPPKKKQVVQDASEEEEEVEPPPPPPCILTGAETVTYSNLDPIFSDPIDIQILVCNTCPDATVSANGTWGASDSILNYNNPSCTSGDPGLTLTLAKPASTPRADSETISVFANGQLIDSITWPPFDNF